MASEAGDPSSSQDVAPVPAIALVQSHNELLSSNNCPNCKVLNRHLKISREWNNFFRLKLDQTDMLLHVAADYKRQKQRCLQLQMSLDQQSRECGEMREQLTNLLLEVNPLKERVQLAEDSAKEERLRREKAESDDCNLRFLIEQQKHKIKRLEKMLQPNLKETMETKISRLKAEIYKLKQDNSYKSRQVWELQQEAALRQARQQRTRKKAYWGLSLAHKYGSLLLSQGQLPEDFSKEWEHLKSVHEDAKRALDMEYLALCQHVRVRPKKDAWLEDFSEWQEGAGGYCEGKQLEKLIQDTSEEIVSEEDGEEGINEKKTEENFREGNYQDSVRSQDITSSEPKSNIDGSILLSEENGEEGINEKKTEENLREGNYQDSVRSQDITSSEPKSNIEGRILLSKTQMQNLPEMLSTSLLDIPAGSTLAEETSHIIDIKSTKNEKAITKSASILDTSAEDSDSDAIPSKGGTEVRKIVTKSTSPLDLSGECSPDHPIPGTMRNSKKDHNVGGDKLTSSLASYHLDAELRAVLEKMRPHEKLEDMESSSPHSSEGPNHVKTDLHDLHVKQDIISLLSNSEEEKGDQEMLQAEGDEEDEISMPPRILTAQMSEGFHVTTMPADNGLHDDLNLSTETCDPDDEVEEDKDIQKRVPVLHFPPTQSFSCDLEEEEPFPKTMQSSVFKPEEAGDGYQRQQISCQPQQAVDNDSNTGSISDSLNAHYKANLRELRETFVTVDDSFTSEERVPMDAKEKEIYMEKQDKSNKDVENIIKVLERNTKPPKPKEAAVQGKSKKSVEEYTREKMTVVVNEAIVGKKEEAKTKEEGLSEAKTQRPPVTEGHKISDEKDGNAEKGDENVIVPEKERNSSAKEERTIDARSKKNKEAEGKTTTYGIKERITVVKEQNPEAVMKVKATHSVGKIPLNGQRMSEALDDVFIEEEENKFTSVLGMNSEMLKERNEDDVEDITLGDEERITDAAKEAVMVAVEKVPVVEKKKPTEIMKERTTYSRKESTSDCERKIIYETVEKVTSKSPEKIITKTVEDKTATCSESILVHAQEQSTKDLKEKCSHPDDERANEKNSALPLEQNLADEININEAVQERAMLSLEKNVIKEIITEAVKDRNMFVVEEIHINKENKIVGAEERNNDTFEQKATNTIQNRSSVAMEERASETTEEKNFKDVGNKNNGERKTETITKRNSDIEETNIKSFGKKKTMKKNIQSFEERTPEVREEICTTVEERNAKAFNAGNEIVGEKGFINEKDNVQSKNRVMRKVLKWMEQNEEKLDDQHTSSKMQLRRQRKFESELVELRQEEKGRKLRGCVLRRIEERAKLEKEKKVKKQNVNRRNVMTIKGSRNKSKLEEKIAERTMSSEIREEEEVEEGSKKQEKEEEIIKKKKLKMVEKETGKNLKNEGNLEETEFEAGVEEEENESRIETEENRGIQDEIARMSVEEEKGSQYEENMMQTEENLTEGHRKKEEMTEEEEKKMKSLEEKETQKEQEKKIKKQEEGKRIKEKEMLPLKDKKENAVLKLFRYEVGEERKLELNQKEGNKRMEEKECQKNILYTEENSKETQRSSFLEERPIMDTSKQKKNIVFCWNFKRTKRGNITKFTKRGRLMRVIPDPPGSLRHSVYTMECRIQFSEEQQRSRICREIELPQGINEGQEIFCKDRITGIIKNFEKTSTSQVEEATGGMMNKKGEREINKDSNNKNLKRKKDVVRNEKAFKIGSKRKKETSCPSDERMTLCSSGELQDRNGVSKQCLTCSRNTAIKFRGCKVCCPDRIRQLKSRPSHTDLFGSDSSNSSEENEEKTVVKVSRVSKEKEQQQLQSFAYKRNKYKRLPMSFDSAVNEKEKHLEQVKIRRTKELSSSSCSSFFAPEVTKNSDEESISEERSPKKSLNQESHHETSSESDIPQRPFSRKCKTTVVLSDTDDHEDYNSSCAMLQRKRLRKLWTNGSTVNKEVDYNNDSDHSSPGPMRHVPSYISARPPTAHSRTKNDVQRKIDSESCVDIYPLSSATLDATPNILQNKLSTVSTEQQKKIILSDKKFNQHSVPQKQQKTKEITPQGSRKPIATKKSPVTPPSVNQSLERLEIHGFGQQDINESARILLKDGHGKKTATESAYTTKRKHGVVLLDIPPHCKRQKGINSELDFSNESDIILDTDEVGGHKEGTLILPLQNNGSVRLQDEKNAQPQSESVAQVLSDIDDHNEKSSMMQSDCENENELIIDENVDNGTDTNSINLSSSYFKATSVKTQKDIVHQAPHLGHIAYIDRPRYRPKPTAAPKLASQTPVPAGPDYTDKLFLKLKEKNAIGSELNNSCETRFFSPAEDIHFKQSQRNANSQTKGTSSQRYSQPTYHLKRVDYQGQCQVPLPNMYGTLDPPATSTSALPSHNPNVSHAHSEPTTCQPLQTMPRHFSPFNEQSKSDQTFSTLDHSHPTLDCPPTTSDQLQPTPTKPNLTPGQSQPLQGNSHHTYNHCTPVTDHSHSTSGQPHETPCHTTSSHSQHSLPGPQLHQVWIPEIITKRGSDCDKEEGKHAPVTIEYLKETLEEVVAGQVCSRWWVTGLKELCNSLTNSTLPSFLRLVIESILRSDLHKIKKYGLPPRLYKLFQVVCILEQRLTPQHPGSLRRALLRAIQAIVVQSDIKIRPHSLASLTAWYVSSISIDDQHEAGQEWGRARAFLVDLLFHHPGTSHLAILTAVNTCSNFFLNHVHKRGLSGLEQVVMWLAHYGKWEGLPGVRSDLTKSLCQHFQKKHFPQSPASLAKNLVTLLEPGKNKDIKWGAIVGLVILTRWQGRFWAKKHLLPALSAATTSTTAITSQQKDPGRENLSQHDLKNKLSHLFGNLGEAVPRVPQENQIGDIVKKMEHAVNTLLCFQ